MKVYATLAAHVAVCAVGAIALYVLNIDDVSPEKNFHDAAFVFLCMSAIVTAVILGYATHIVMAEDRAGGRGARAGGCSHAGG